MKKSSEWVRKQGLDKMLDQLVEQRGITPAELNTYDAAKALDIEPSGDFYKKVRDWKQRRAAASGHPVMVVPPHILAGFRETVDRFADDAIISFERAVGGIGGDIRRNADQRIVEAEQRAEGLQSEVNGLLDHWAAAEAERDAARARVAELEQQVEELRRAKERLLGRLEQRDLDAHAEETTPEAAGERKASAPPVGNTRPDMTALAQALAYGPPDDTDDAADDAAPLPEKVSPTDVDGVATAVVDGQDQPPAIATPPAPAGQVDVPLVDDAAADQADGGGDDRV